MDYFQIWAKIMENIISNVLLEVITLGATKRPRSLLREGKIPFVLIDAITSRPGKLKPTAQIYCSIFSRLTHKNDSFSFGSDVPLFIYVRSTIITITACLTAIFSRHTIISFLCLLFSLFIN